MVDNNIIATGYGGLDLSTGGELVVWNRTNLTILEGKIVYVGSSLPLYQAALIAKYKPAGVILAIGNRNYHPLIFFKDLLIPCIAGTGLIDPLPSYVFMSCKKGIIYSHSIIDDQKKNNIYEVIDTDNEEVFANIGSEEAIEISYKIGAAGIGIFRTEFTAVRMLAEHLNYLLKPNYTLENYIIENSEADAIYLVANHSQLQIYLKEAFIKVIRLALRYFPEKSIIIRSIDIERDERDSLGYRGIRRCIAENGGVLKIIIQALKEISLETNHKNISLIFPLVSEYSQISIATNMVLDSGLQISNSSLRNYIKIGWKIEQPSSALNTNIWLNTFFLDFDVFPHYLGIGTNDLTQFTLGVGRYIPFTVETSVVRKYIDNLYNEFDFAIIKQLILISRSVANKNTIVIIHGELAADNRIARLLNFLKIYPSVTVLKLNDVFNSFRKLRHFDVSFEEALNDIIDNEVVSLREKDFIKKDLKFWLQSLSYLDQ
ncbi:putative PEP-binding protein [Larkinella rosea]|uniref:PEP-utilising enzyme C-terminal domain-containing protein n=1 Tax=Larkinella rosea TaxID=2025312 RepID=A0A3P1BDP5_9BACT|nr:putative PEP-binding protein [Larkinella rosea]RRA98623.1 hypothetical protein EHT25_26830 [Larkinella rosea]